MLERFQKSEMKRHILNQLDRRLEIAEFLANSLNIPTCELFYAWDARKIDQQGILKSGWGYFFHGLDCSLSNSQTGEKVRLEFIPNGRVDGLTKSTLVDMDTSDIYYPKKNASKIFDLLLEDGTICIADEELYKKVKSLTRSELQNFMANLPNARQSDINICDRFKLKE